MTTVLALIIVVGLAGLVYKVLNLKQQTVVKEVVKKVEKSVHDTLDVNHDGHLDTNDITTAKKKAQKITAKVGRKPRKPKKTN